MTVAVNPALLCNPVVDEVQAAKRYGIVSSTTLDQTTRFQAMCDDLNAGHNGARRVILPAGEIHIDGDINIYTGGAFGFWPTYDTLTAGIGGIHIDGQGMYATQIVQEGVGGTIRVYENNAGTGRQYNQFEMGRLSLIGPGLTDPSNIGIQLGGVSTAASDIVEAAILHDLRIQNFATCIAADDATGLYLHRILCEGYNYGIEFGFNVDLVKILQSRFGSSSIPSAYTCTTTNASATVTLTGGFLTTNLRVGMNVKGANFARGTTIASITDSTHFEASATASATSADTLYFTQGIALSFGRGPFVGAWPSASTGGGNAISIETSWFMRNAECIAVDDVDNANIKFDSCYFERCERIATLGPGSGSSTTYFAIWDNCHFSQSNLGFKDFAIYENAAAGAAGNIVIRNCRSDQSSPAPWVRLRSASGRLTWENNILPVSSGSRINIFDSATAYNPADNSTFYHGVYAQNNEQFTLGVTGTLTPLVPARAAISYKVGAMTGNVTIAAPSMTYGVEGQRIKFMFLEDGTAGHSVTWNAAFHFHTAWTNSTVTTDANKRSYVEFEYTGSVWMQVSPANVWTA